MVIQRFSPKDGQPVARVQCWKFFAFVFCRRFDGRLPLSSENTCWQIPSVSKPQTALRRKRNIAVCEKLDYFTTIFPVVLGWTEQ
jgi:hypothetical protein